MIANSSKSRTLNFFPKIQFNNSVKTRNNSEVLQKRKLSFISELTVLLFIHNQSKNEFQKISNLIVSTLKAPDIFFFHKVFSFNGTNPFENFKYKEYLKTIEKISILLKQPSFLSVQEVLKNCSIERFFLNLYLKDLTLKNNRINDVMMECANFFPKC